MSAFADMEHINAAIELLKRARQQLRLAKSNKAADYVGRALKSTEGAQRHAYRVAGDPTVRRHRRNRK